MQPLACHEMAILKARTVTLYLDEEAHDGPMNMAIDEALLRHCTQPVVRFYQWKAPTLSVGYFQPLAEAGKQDMPIVRRWTGGGMVYHGGDRTFSIAAPRDTELGILSPEISYRYIHEGMIRAFGKNGLRLAECEDRLSGAACFQSPALHDVLQDAKKIAGGAQRRSRAGVLHQGSIQQIETSGEFPARFAAEFGEKVIAVALPADVLETAHQLVKERYGSPQWLTKF
ncbi:MAG: hypothetical protein ABI615_02900 [Chthoniobacterales bacterium]